MDFYSYNTFDALQDQKSDWDHLCTHSASDNPFLTFEYQQAWWQTRGGGEWPESSQLVLVVGFEGDQLIGLAPLFHANNLAGQSVLIFVGAIEVSDFLDFIAKPEDLPSFIAGLLEFLTTDPALPVWECLDFHNILGDSPSLNLLKSEAEQRGWTHQQIHLQRAPYIPLPDDYDTYLEGLVKKQRHEIHRKLRNINQSPLAEALVFAEDQNTIHADTQSLLELMAQDPSKKDFLSPTMRQHLHNTAQIAFDAGWLQLAFLTLDGRKAAANMAFRYNNRLWLYNSGWEWEFRDFSPGWVLLAQLIKWAIAHKISEFDFMRGDETYKYKFGAIDRQIFRVTLTP
jgi:CelD/BcsL family acetyltransferase involved in cellulose biosynthesis